VGAVRATGGPFRVELFTHPVCQGCREATAALTRLARAGEIELVQWSLAVRSGRARAEETGVTSVPSVVVGAAMRELATRESLEAFLAELRSGALGA